MPVDPQLIAFTGVFLGVFFKTMIPYIKKWKEAHEANQTLKFDNTYAVTAIFSGILSFIATMLIFPAFALPENIKAFTLLGTAFTYGFTVNSVINEIIS